MYLYGIFMGSKWCMGWNKRKALKFAKQNKGEVRRMLDPKDTMSWDAPTFQICSEQIADFR